MPNRAACLPNPAALEKAIEALLLASGAALDDETAKTPARVARTLIEDLLDGYQRDPLALMKTSLSPAPHPGQLVMLAELDFHALCPHHLLPYRGSAAIAYVAEAHIVGFGAITDVLAALAHRLILQEQLAHLLVQTLGNALSPRGVGVQIVAEHSCMRLRGTKQRRSQAVVQAWSGVFESDATLRAVFKSALA